MNKKYESHGHEIDCLTGVYNRAKLKDDIRVMAKNNMLSTFLVLDIDHFDKINTVYNEDTGDKCLFKIARILQQITPDDSILYSLGGDEFVIVCPSNKKADILELADKIQSVFAKHKIRANHHSIDITFTIGISLNSNRRGFEKAKIAIREARRSGKRNCVHIYSEGSEYIDHQKKELDNIKAGRYLLENDKIVPYFQAIRCNKKNIVCKFECLARAIDDGKIYRPDEFLNGIKSAGLNSVLTEVMIDKSFSFFSKYDYEFSINITEDDICADFVDSLVAKAILYSIDPSRVILETHESITHNNIKVSSKIFKLLKKHGFKLAIDDFGNDNSNFSRLKNMEVDYIKIDGMFIKNIHTDKTSQDIVQTIMHLANKIGAKIVAEYVADGIVSEAVKGMGIEFSQGFYFGQPLSAEDFVKNYAS